MDEILTKPNAIYWTTLAIVVIIEHLILGERWRSNELARRVVGVATVTLGMLPLIVWGGLDWTTWAVQFAGFGVAGFIVFLAWTWRQERERQERIERKRQPLDEKVGELSGGAARTVKQQGTGTVRERDSGGAGDTL